MPHRIEMLWHHVGLPVAWISAISAALGAITADGLAAAITVVGLALCVTLAKLAKPLGDAIREVGFAWAEVRGRMRRELSETRADVDRNSSEIEVLRSEAAEARVVAAGARKVAAENAARAEAVARDLEAARAEADKLRDEMARAEAYNSKRRHDQDSILQARTFEIAEMRGQVEDYRAQLARLRAGVGLTSKAHAEVINTVADSVEIVADRLDPPLPEPLRLPHLEAAPFDPDGPDAVAPAAIPPPNPPAP